jgi:predicted lipoprotein with Yx(FWY)xxD motif
MTSKPRSKTNRVAAIALVVILAALLTPAAAGARQTSKVVAKKADNSVLGETVLTNTKGRTLYSLSAEMKGRFICTAACLSIWHPLIVKDGVKPAGPVKLGTVERPDSRTQVTYKGRPLYGFGGDTKAGQANGQGIKDVGTWRAASIAKISPQPEPEPQPPPNPYPGPYGY